MQWPSRRASSIAPRSGTDVGVDGVPLEVLHPQRLHRYSIVTDTVRWQPRVRSHPRLSVLAEAPWTAPALRSEVRVQDGVRLCVVGPAGLEPATERL
jgi:hypothetical protein